MLPCDSLPRVGNSSVGRSFLFLLHYWSEISQKEEHRNASAVRWGQSSPEPFLLQPAPHPGSRFLCSSSITNTQSTPPWYVGCLQTQTPCYTNLCKLLLSLMKSHSHLSRPRPWVRLTVLDGCVIFPRTCVLQFIQQSL